MWISVKVFTRDMSLVNSPHQRNDAAVSTEGILLLKLRLTNVALIVLPMLLAISCASMRGAPQNADTLRVVQTDSGPYDPSTLSPDGKIMYFTWAITGTPQVWKVVGPMRFPQQITGAPEANQIWATTPDGESLIVLRRAVKASAKAGIAILSKSGELEALVPNDLACDLKPFWITNDNSKLYYTCFDQVSDKTSIFSYAIDSSRSEPGGHDTKRELVFKEPGLWSAIDVQNDQSFLLAKGTEYFQWSPNEKILNPIVGLPARHDPNVRFARTGEALFLDSVKNQFFILKKGHATELEMKPPIEGAVRSFTIDRRRLRLYVEAKGDTLEVYDLRPDSQIATRIRLPDLSALNSPQVKQTSRYDRYVILNGRAATSSFVQMVYDWKDQKPTQWLPSVSEAVPPVP